MTFIRINPDKIPKPDPKEIGIEIDGVVCSATREDQNGLIAVFIAYQIQKDNFQPTEFVFQNGNKILITKEKIDMFIKNWLPFRQSFFIPK